MARTHSIIRFVSALFLAVCFTAGVFVSQIYAADDAAEPGKDMAVEETVDAKPVSSNPYIADLQVVAEDLVEGLDEDALKSLYEIRQIFGITRSVRIVHGDVKNAVGLCAEENEVLAEEIKGRFESWEKAVMTPLEAAEAKMQTMIAEQDFRPAVEIKGYLDLTKKAADYAENQIEKRPVTKEAECRALIKSMDNTEAALVSLLSNIDRPVEAEQSTPSADEKAPTKEKKD